MVKWEAKEGAWRRRRRDPWGDGIWNELLSRCPLGREVGKDRTFHGMLRKGAWPDSRVSG